MLWRLALSSQVYWHAITLNEFLSGSGDWVQTSNHHLWFGKCADKCMMLHCWLSLVSSGAKGWLLDPICTCKRFCSHLLDCTKLHALNPPLRIAIMIMPSCIVCIFAMHWFLKWTILVAISCLFSRRQLMVAVRTQKHSRGKWVSDSELRNSHTSGGKWLEWLAMRIDVNSCHWCSPNLLVLVLL